MSCLWAPMQVFTSMQPQYIIIQLEPPLLLIFCLPQNCLIPQSFFSKNFHVMHFLKIECKQVLKIRMLWIIKHLAYWIIKKDYAMQAGVNNKKNYAMQIGRADQDTIQLSITAIFDVKQSLNNTTCWSSIAFLFLIIIVADLHVHLSPFWWCSNLQKLVCHSAMILKVACSPSTWKQWLACRIYLWAFVLTLVWEHQT